MPTEIATSVIIVGKQLTRSWPLCRNS